MINRAVAETTKKENHIWRELEGPHRRILSIQCSINEIKSKNRRLDWTFYLPGIVTFKQPRPVPKEEKGKAEKKTSVKIESNDETERLDDLGIDVTQRRSSERSRPITRESVFSDALEAESNDESWTKAKETRACIPKEPLPMSFGGLLRKTVRLARDGRYTKSRNSDRIHNWGSKDIEDTCHEQFSTASNRLAEPHCGGFRKLEQHIEQLSKEKLLNLKLIIDRKIRNNTENKENDSFPHKKQRKEHRQKSRVSSSKKVNFSNLSKESLGGLSELTEKARRETDEEERDCNEHTVVTTLSELEINGYIHKYYDCHE